MLRRRPLDAAARVWRAGLALALAAMCALLLQERQIRNLGWEIGGFLPGCSWSACSAMANWRAAGRRRHS